MGGYVGRFDSLVAQPSQRVPDVSSIIKGERLHDGAAVRQRKRTPGWRGSESRGSVRL